MSQMIKGYLEDDPKGKNKQETQQFLNATFTLISFLTTIVVVLGIILTPFIVRIFYKGSRQHAPVRLS